MEIVKNVSIKETVDTLRIIFSRNGLPSTIVSDNASCFTGYEFTRFLSDNGIYHMTSPAYMPACNGQAERGVRVVKNLLNKLSKSDSLKCRLAKALFYYRSTPQNTSKIAPSVLLNNRKLISAKDRVHPKYGIQANDKQVYQFKIGDKVLALNGQKGPKWYRAAVTKQLGVNVYEVYVEDLGVVWKRHKNQLAYISSGEQKVTHKFPDLNREVVFEPELRRSSRIRTAPDRLGYN